jgi:hypothetical protein
MMGTPQFWQSLSKYIPFWLGVFATGALMAISQGLLDAHPEFRRWISWAVGLLAVYGITGVAVWPPPRIPWTPEQKVQESMRRIAMGMAPLVGYEYLLTGRGGPGPGPDPTSPPPPLFTPAPPPLPPATDAPNQDVPPKKGA